MSMLIIFYRVIASFRLDHYRLILNAKSLLQIATCSEPYCSEQVAIRSEEHTSELQSRFDLVCRLLLEKKNIRHNISSSKGPKLLQLKLLTTYIPKTSTFTIAFSTS